MHLCLEIVGVSQNSNLYPGHDRDGLENVLIYIGCQNGTWDQHLSQKCLPYGLQCFKVNSTGLL